MVAPTGAGPAMMLGNTLGNTLGNKLGNAAPSDRASPDAGRCTIEEVFAQHARRRPDALALVDAANRTTFTDHEARRLTYADADRVVSAIAARLGLMGLPPDSIVAIQLPNTVEAILALLGVLRAGMIAAPLPLLWRRTEAVAALGRVGAKALLTCGRVGTFDHGRSAMAVAADVFSIRYVCGFGANLPDGVVSFDDLFATEKADVWAADRARHGPPTAQIAAITFDMTAGGVVPVARTHAELLAGGVGILLEGSIAPHANVLSTIAPSSFAGLCLTLMPWLLCGGTLVLHHPFDAATLRRQLRQDRCGTLILPGSAALRLAEVDDFAANPLCIVAAWRLPHMLWASPPWRDTHSALVDVSIFGETVLVPARRDADGKPRGLPNGTITTPRTAADGIVVAELTRSEAGTVAARGAMVPQHAFPPGIASAGLPYFKVEPAGFVDTGYACRIDSFSNAIVVTDAPSGIVSVGGYRFSLGDLRESIGHIDEAATVAALPDPIIGQRLIGNAADRETMQAALAAAEMNPIVVAAFADRGITPAA
jgi:acyl-CoA synthetase (AMP-forming)/AMP-acid ligase II